LLRSAKTALFATLLVLSAVSSVKAQPVLRLGYSGTGVTQNLYAVIDKAGLWTKYNLDVKAIYFNSGSLLGQAMVGGDIELATDST
jgi:ABC-type nitrate/sulfonate/bicarbonate transport system substrate-binding protein